MSLKHRHSSILPDNEIDTASAQTREESSLERRSKLLVCESRGSASRRPSVLTCTVLLQAMKQDPPLDAKCRDKFLVQSVAVTPDREFDNVGSIVGYIGYTSSFANC